MLSPVTEKLVQEKCRYLCETIGLSKVYLAETVGPRRHYLAGHGDTSLEQPNQLQLSDKITVLWCGKLCPETKEFFIRSLRTLAEQVERELPPNTPRND